MLRTTLAFCAFCLVMGCATAPTPVAKKPAQKPEPVLKIVPKNLISTPLSAIKWRKGGPKAPPGILVHGLSGDPKTGRSAAIVKLAPGTKIPLHFHTSGFSGVTLTDGLAHARTMKEAKPLPAGSFWFQAANETHVDVCMAKTDCLLLVMFKGPLDTQFTKETKDAINPGKVTPFNTIKWKAMRPKMKEKSPKMALIQGNPKSGPFDALLYLPPGTTTDIHMHSHSFVGAIISGTHHRGPSPMKLTTLTQGGVWSEKANASHMEKCGKAAPCVFAMSFEGPLDHKSVNITNE